ncbi:polyphosphate polymerase domain-containing protein [Bdellovibrio sp. NC01]|uniref:polyphosphate polymerase domain-containing protein n=1 Tax=Bdellovibrio sp. NC01 TaxID=2220073 RepID=UPI00115805EE|nr:polyphosphate polymerase domain-containing protein [Bdellovibrio sp. NC01]QDK38690.1 VTC domain-containing protein [Bdellovibrio sp. NC01]
MSGPVSPLALERYELKYLIPLSMVEPISKFVEAYCEMDYYSQISGDNYYTINSLYLDSPTHYLFRAKESANAFSFNMRVRSYGVSPVPPYYYEIKYKIRDFVKKKRAKVMNDWAQILQHSIIPEDAPAESIKNMEDFVFMSHTYNVQPTILTQYRRKAYLSVVDDYARVTFDRDLRYQETNDWTITPDERYMCHYDIPEWFEEPGQNVVLELKCEKKIPVWMVDLIRRFDLNHASFSKYGNSMTTLYTKPDVFAPGHLYR